MKCIYFGLTQNPKGQNKRIDKSNKNLKTTLQGNIISKVMTNNKEGKIFAIKLQRKSLYS